MNETTEVVAGAPTRHEEKMKELFGALQALDPDGAEYAVRRTEKGYELVKTIGVLEGSWIADDADSREAEVEDCAAEALQELLHTRELARDAARERARDATRTLREATRTLREAEEAVAVFEKHGARKLLKEYGR